RRLVDYVSKLGAGLTGRASRNHRKIDTFGELHFLGVHPQNFFAPFNVRKVDSDLAIKTARTEQCGIEHVGSVRRGDNDHTLLSVKAVHFNEQPIQRLLAFVIPATNTGTPAAANPL